MSGSAQLTRPGRRAQPSAAPGDEGSARTRALPPPMPGESTDVELRAAAFVATAAPGRPLDWSSLPKLSRRGVLAARALPLASSRLQRILDGVVSDWTHDLGAPVTVSCVSVGAAAAGDAPAAPGCHALLALGGTGALACFALDAPLAAALVDRLSGGEGRPAARLVALGAVERGVLSYLLLRALGRVAADSQLAPLRPQLLSLGESPPASAFDGLGALNLTLQVDAGFAQGAARLTLPESALAALGSTPRRALALPPALCNVSVSLAFELAAARVAAAELVALAVGDVVVCDRVAAPPANAADSAQTLVGRLRARGGSMTVAATAHSEGNGWRVVVGSRIEQEALPMTEPVPGEALAADAPVSLIIELGRIAIHVGELAALRTGDTLLLGRAPGAPLDLVAGGEVIARGELVDVEGELGLRILHVR